MPAGKPSKSQRKYLPTGEINPDYKPRASRARLLPDGSPNPNYEPKPTRGPRRNTAKRKKSNAEKLTFVAWDGEGENVIIESHPLYEEYNTRRVDLLYYVHTLGGGHIKQTHIDRVRKEAQLLMLLDQKSGFLVGFRDRETISLLADPDDSIVLACMDSIRDRRLRGRLGRGGTRTRNTGEGLRLIGEEEGAERLRENRPRAFRSGRVGGYALPQFKTGLDLDKTPELTSPHIYTLLAAGWYDHRGEWHEYTLQAKPGRRLTTGEILEFIWSVVEDTPRSAIHVGFSFNYDVAHILYDMPPDQLAYALAPTFALWGWYGPYTRIKVTPRKTLEVRDRRRGKNGYIRIWDVYGFFQSSFVNAIKNWLGPDYPDLPLIEQGKGQRGGEGWGEVDPVAYNRAELKALCLLMKAVGAAFLEAGLKLQRWDGAGAAAVAAYRAHMPKGWFEAAREPIRENSELDHACHMAYFGGRIENLVFGSYRGPIYHADINSAYPAALVTAPDLAAGEWRHIQSRGERLQPEQHGPMTVFHVKWDFTGQKITPFPLRLEDGSIVFPERGEGWYWSPEVIAVTQILQGRKRFRYGEGYNWRGAWLEIIEAWEFVPEQPEARPFAWVAELYAERLRLRKQAGGEGKQKAIKLAINSLYGKLAQHVGYQSWVTRYENPVSGKRHTLFRQSERLPPFYNLALAGYITSHCRAKLLSAAMTNPEGIICFATDGIYSTLPIEVPTGPDKILGEWETEHYPEADFIMVQPGIYYLNDGGRWKEASRGFPYAKGADRNAAIAERVELIKSAWTRYVEQDWPAYEQALAEWVKDRSRPRPEPPQCFIRVDATRLMGLRASLVSQVAWNSRGCWVGVTEDGELGRKLRLYGASDKRSPDEETPRTNPAETFVGTHPVLTKHTGKELLMTRYPVSVPYDGVPYIPRLEYEDLEGDMLDYYGE